MSLDGFWTLLSFLLLLLGVGLYKLKQSFESPGIYLSSIEAFSKAKTLKERLYWLPDLLFYLGLAFLLIALTGPHRETSFLFNKGENMPPPIQEKGLAIYLLLDHSGSMYQEVTVTLPGQATKTIRKIDLLKELTKKFVQGDKNIGLKGRDSDLIGLVEFARTAQIVSPLTLDHESIINEIDRLTINRDINQIGTSIGYAIYKTVNEIAATKRFAKEMDKTKTYNIQNSIIIIVTDGFQETNPNDENHPLRSMDVFKAAEEAKKEGIKLYIVNIDPKLNTAEYATNRELFTLVAKYTGGKFFMAETSKNLADIYKEIDQLEKSEVPAYLRGKKSEPASYVVKDYASFLFIKIGLFLILIHFILKFFILKPIP